MKQVRALLALIQPGKRKIALFAVTCLLAAFLVFPAIGLANDPSFPVWFTDLVATGSAPQPGETPHLQNGAYNTDTAYSCSKDYAVTLWKYVLPGDPNVPLEELFDLGDDLITEGYTLDGTHSIGFDGTYFVGFIPPGGQCWRKIGANAWMRCNGFLRHSLFSLYPGEMGGWNCSVFDGPTTDAWDASSYRCTRTEKVATDSYTWQWITSPDTGWIPYDCYSELSSTPPPSSCLTDPSLCPPPPPPPPTCLADPSLCQPPPEQNTIAQTWKSGWHSADTFFTINGTIFAAEGNPFSEGVGLTFDLADEGGKAISWVLGNDPPDPNYQQIFQPVFPKLPKIKPNRSLNKKAAKALTKVAASGAYSYGFGMALLHCIERAQGAAAAGDTQWVHQQRSCAAANATQLAQTLGDQITLRHAAKKALISSHVPNFKVSKAAVKHSLAPLKKGKLTGTLGHAANLLKLDAEQRQNLITSLLAAKPQPGLKLFDAIDGPDVVKGLKAAQAAAAGVASQFSTG